MVSSWMIELGRTWAMHSLGQLIAYVVISFIFQSSILITSFAIIGFQPFRVCSH